MTSRAALELSGWPIVNLMPPYGGERTSAFYGSYSDATKPFEAKNHTTARDSDRERKAPVESRHFLHLHRNQSPRIPAQDHQPSRSLQSHQSREAQAEAWQRQTALERQRSACLDRREGGSMKKINASRNGKSRKASEKLFVQADNTTASCVCDPRFSESKADPLFGLSQERRERL